MTAIAVIPGRSPPLIPHNLVSQVEVLQIAKEAARAAAVCSTRSLLPESDSITVTASAIQVGQRSNTTIHKNCACVI